MRKNVSAILLFATFLMSVICLFSFNKHVNADELIKTASKSAYCMDYDTKTVLYSKNENQKLPIASMCKIMTLNLIFEEIEKGNVDINGEIYVSENASGMGGSQIFLDANKNYPVKELIKGIVVASANDACVAFAEKISGNEDFFVEKMNQKAKELQMENTVFTNCTGLPKVGQFSTAEDVAKMFSELLTHKDYFDYSNIWMDEIHHPEKRITQISNTNKLIRFYQGCDSGKTGYTSEAGHCLACSAIRNNLRIITVIISAPDSKTRFKDTTSLFNYAFANFENKTIVDSKNILSEKLEVANGKKNYCPIAPEENFIFLTRKGEKNVFEIEVNLNKKIKAPIKIGQKIGTMHIYKDGLEIKTINLVAKEKINKKNYFDLVNTLIKKWNVL